MDMSGTLGWIKILRLLLHDFNHFSKGKCVYFCGVSGYMELLWGPLLSELCALDSWVVYKMECVGKLGLG